MATIKQKLAVQKIVENGGNVSRSMIEVGYSPATAKTPDKLTDSKGYQELLNEYLPDDFILGALKDDIEKKPQNRVAELNLATKVKGMQVDKVDHTTQGDKIVFNVVRGIDEQNT